MPDVVVTVPKDIWLRWLQEGDMAGTAATGEEWGFYTSGGTPRIEPGERVYVVAWGRVRGYSPLTKVVKRGRGLVFCRKAGAVAVTIPAPVRGFRGWMYTWWDRKIDVPFPSWRTEGVDTVQPCPTCAGRGFLATLDAIGIPGVPHGNCADCSGVGVLTKEKAAKR